MIKAKQKANSLLLKPEPPVCSRPLALHHFSVARGSDTQHIKTTCKFHFWYPSTCWLATLSPTWHFEEEISTVAVLSGPRSRSWAIYSWHHCSEVYYQADNYAIACVCMSVSYQNISILLYIYNRPTFRVKTRWFLHLIGISKHKNGGQFDRYRVIICCGSSWETFTTLNVTSRYTALDCA